MVYHIKLYNGFVYPEFLTSPLSSSEIEPGAGVGKSCLLLRFADDTYTEPMGKDTMRKVSQLMGVWIGESSQKWICDLEIQWNS